MPFRVVDGKNEIPETDCVPTTLFLTAGRGQKCGRCPGSAGHLCCNYLTIDLYEGCPIGCSYCIMKSYLNFKPVTVNVDTEAIGEEMEQLFDRFPGRVFRIGTGETGDSLFYDPLIELSADLVARAAVRENVFFELKTKTAYVDHLLSLEPKGKTVIGFSLNPEVVAAAEEGWAHPLIERLAAAQRAVRAGYLVSFHFDPIIRISGWEAQYKGVIEQLRVFPAGRIAWISLGTVRYPGELASRMGERPYLFDEFVRCRDGKYRYLQPIRVAIYRTMRRLLAKVTSAPVYMCMESPAVWKRVFGKLPSKIDSLCAIFSNETAPYRFSLTDEMEKPEQEGGTR